MKKYFHLVVVVALSFSFVTACSRSSTKKSSPDASAPSVDSSAVSSADVVGSVPEDASQAEELASVEQEEPETLKKETSPLGDIVNLITGSGSDIKLYKVKAGDTLMKIAFSLYGDIDRWKDLHDLNKDKLKTASKLRAGMKLKYEEGDSFEREEYAEKYLIQKGDTLAGIADDVYGRKAKWKKLQKFNSKLIKNPNVIFAGFTLYYDITPKEIAEAEARKKDKLASGGGVAPVGAPVTVTVAPAPASVAPPTAVVVAPQPSAVSPVDPK